MILSIGVVTILLVGAPAAMADNWPGFRGPTRQGVSLEDTEFPLEWGPERNVAWKTPIPGSGWSSPIVWKNRIFVTTATEEGRSCHVLSLDADTGGIIWNKHVFDQEPERKRRQNSYASSTPVTDGERVYAVFADGSIVALDFDGNVVWENRDFDFFSEHGLGASPVLFDDLLIMPFDPSSRTQPRGEDRLQGSLGRSRDLGARQEDRPGSSGKASDRPRDWQPSHPT